MALSGLRSAFIRQTVKLTRVVVTDGVQASAFLAAKRQRFDYYIGLLESLRATPPATASPFMVLLRSLEVLED